MRSHETSFLSNIHKSFMPPGHAIRFKFYTIYLDLLILIKITITKSLVYFWFVFKVL